VNKDRKSREFLSGFMIFKLRLQQRSERIPGSRLASIARLSFFFLLLPKLLG
jgi:hypothetical protein